MSPQLLRVGECGIYNDLMQKFVAEGHNVYIMVPFERGTGRNTELFQANGENILGVKTLNVTRTNLVEKGIGQLLLEYQFKMALKKHLGNIKFDLILYSTPPITFTKVIEYAKMKNPGSIAYLMLKDIFPQNAVDLGMLKKSGLKGLLYKSFRKKEEKLYQISDVIGCMSPANISYVLTHNPKIQESKTEICPNSFSLLDSEEMHSDVKKTVRQKFYLPTNKPVFIYGGNLGKPQGIPFLLECLRANKNRTDCHFVIVGNGTEYSLIEDYIKREKPQNCSLYQRLPKEDYDKLTNACDIGLIFLDYRFTIPNYPSRLLPYLMTKKPIVACTDTACDVGTIAEKNGYGFYCPSNDVNAFTSTIDKILSSDIKQMGENGYQFYLSNYTVQHTYDPIIEHIIQ